MPEPHTSSPVAGRPTAVVFRKVLLPWSETFIGAQGGALSRYRPVFAGYRYDPRGAGYLGDHDRVVLDEHRRLPLAVGKVLLGSLGVPPRRWLRELRARDPVIVHAHFGTNAPPALALGRSLGVPVLVTFHGYDISTVARRAGQRRARARVFRDATHIIAVSAFIRDRLLDAGCPADKVTVHHIGVDTDRVRPGETAPRRPRQVLFVGRLVAKKGLVHLIRALQRVAPELPDVEVVVAGDGSLREALEREAVERRVPMRFLGVQTPAQVLELMQRSALLCAPSVVAASGDAEGLPMTIVEAQAAGLPVIASPSGGSADGFRDGETGILVPAGDEDRLAAALRALLTDPPLLERMSAGARDFAVRHFDLRRQTARLEDIYDRIRGDGAAGGR
jgi:colanic acid/amylovoran biosynthesis glycosyltransferase